MLKIFLIIAGIPQNSKNFKNIENDETVQFLYTDFIFLEEKFKKYLDQSIF